jgi:tRNA(Ile)-lysidine synthase
MVASRTPATADPSPPTEPTRPRVGVAFSGGRDSTALLWACLRVAKHLSVDVVACHVHHGLMPQADHWWHQAQQQCDAWAAEGWPVRFCGVRLTQSPLPGDSVEAWARRARYDALTQMAHQEGLTLMLLGHHQQDQAETVLIQLLRGAGPAGLAGMPAVRESAGLTWARPWLNVSADQVQAYALTHGLAWVEDPSNHDARFVRNRIRHGVLPVLQANFPHAVGDLSRSAAALGEAQAVLREVAQADLAAVQRPDDPHSLAISALVVLSSPRMKQVLRWWGQGLPCERLPESLLVRLDAALRRHPGSGCRWPAPGGSEVTMYRGILAWRPGVGCPAAVARTCLQSSQLAGASPGAESQRSALSLGPGDHVLPGWGGLLRIEVSAHGHPNQPNEVPTTCLLRVTVRARRGSDRFQQQLSGVPRSLKKCFQTAGLPAWERQGPVLEFVNGLLFVPGLGADARLRSTESLDGAEGIREARALLTWLPVDRSPLGDESSDDATRT